MELDGFMWSLADRLPAEPTALILELADAEGCDRVQAIFLGFDRLLCRYRYGIRLSKRSPLQ